MAQNNYSQNQAPVSPKIFRCPACPQTFVGSVSYSRHLRQHQPHERIRRKNVEPVDEAVVEPLPPPPAALPRSRNSVGRTRSRPKHMVSEGSSKRRRKEAAVEDAIVEAPQPPPPSVALPQPQAVVRPAVLPPPEAEQPRARPFFDLNKLPDEQDY